MGFLIFLLKTVFILAAIGLMALPFVMEYKTFCRDKKNKISYKRFRTLVYTVVYVIVATIALYLLKQVILWLESLPFILWLGARIAVPARLSYFIKVLVAVLVNAATGFLYVLFSKLIRIGLKKKELAKPKGKGGDYTRAQKFERKVITFFHTETWFFVARILKPLNISLSVLYALAFAAYLAPAVFGASWIPYGIISAVFGAGYIYPTITLLALWAAYFFLMGIKQLLEECPDIVSGGGNAKAQDVDLGAIDSEVRKQFGSYYSRDVDLSVSSHEDLAPTEHHKISKHIGDAVENDGRNPQKSKEIFLNCTDRLVELDKSLLVNGSFFSEFSMYFLRYLSIIVARGDNVVFVCNSENEIDEVYGYVTEAYSKISGIYGKGEIANTVDFDNPIWKIVKIHGEKDVIDEATVDDKSILITSLSYLCSTHFESEHSKFIHLLDTVVFVDALKTVNTYNRQLAMLNTRLKHITKNNALLSRNGSVNCNFSVRYMSKQVRYICFDSSRTPGLDKVLKNLLAVDLESVDSMNYSDKTLVRCYNYEGRPDVNGRTVCPQYFDADEEVGVLMNMAVLCLAKGASSVTVFTEESIPYGNIAESIAANMGSVSIKADGSKIRLNTHYYNPDDYSVMIVMDSRDNLPATVRKYMSMVSDKPSLVIVFSRPYMLRDYYTDKIDELWGSTQIERIPVEEGTKKEVAQRILVKANAGGISEENILRIASGVPSFYEFVQGRDINAILRAVLEIYGLSQEERIDLYRYFEYSTTRDFDENGVYAAEDKVLLRRQGKLFDMINGRDMTVMSTGDRDIVLPLPKSRLTQNYIAGQNLLYCGNIYHIGRIDTDSGRVYARLAVGGKNDEAYQYVQDRLYRVEFSSSETESVFPTKHVLLKRSDGDVSVDDIYISVFRTPAEVITNGYYEINPRTLALNHGGNGYHSINDPGNDELAKQSYRRYGNISKRCYSSESVMEKTELNAEERGALMMSIRIRGSFGDVNRTMTLAAVMLSELIRSMFPSVADSVAVCPVLHLESLDGDFGTILQRQPKIEIIGEDERVSESDFNLVIIEDCATDLGVVSVLMSSGDDMIRTLFNPIFKYLSWYESTGRRSDYLRFGLDREPDCFDFESLRRLSGLLGDSKHDLNFVDIDSVIEYATCDFCGKRCAKTDGIIELDDGRKMCKSCADSLVGNNKKILKAHLDRAKIFLESTYGINLDDDYEFCFESTVKLVNTLRQNGNLKRRGTDAPLISYIDGKKRVHAEYSLPSVNLSELLVRELTHVWQLKHLASVTEELCEGHIALVAIQYLRFLNQDTLAAFRTNYFESTTNISGEGYRRLVKGLLENPQYNNNPFRYLLSITGGEDGGAIVTPTPTAVAEGELGLLYTPKTADRVLDGRVEYFYRSRLTESKQRLYDALKNGIEKHEATVSATGFSAEEIWNVAEAVEYDHPELFWYKTPSVRGEEAVLNYGASAEEAALLQRRIDEATAKYLAAIDDSMSAYDVAIRLHAALISAVDYDTIALNRQHAQGGPDKDKIDYLRTICGVFLDGKAVCEGYARAMQYLLQKCGVECAEAAGYIIKENGEKSGAHAWNILKIDGAYYYLDTTWDDSSNTVQSVKNTDFGFNYFCITTDELTRTRDISLCPADVPACTEVSANYFYHNSLVLEDYDLDKIKEIAQNAARNKCRAFFFKCKSKAVYDRVIARLFSTQDCYAALKAASRIDRQILSNTFSYSYDKNIWTVQVKFKYK